MTLLDEDQLGAWFGEHQTARGDVAMRVERLPIYRVPQQEDELRAWREGRPQDRANLDPWLDVLADEVDRGLLTLRARVFSEHLTDDELRACHWSYPDIGRYEDIRVLHRGEQPVPAVLDHDYWIIHTVADDSWHVARMHYDARGFFRGAEIVEDVAPYLQEWRLMWALGEPFAPWWGRHRELHRRMAA